MLFNSPQTDPIGPFLEGLKALGYSEGKNISIDYAFADGRAERLPDLAVALVDRKPDVIFEADRGELNGGGEQNHTGGPKVAVFQAHAAAAQNDHGEQKRGHEGDAAGETQQRVAVANLVVLSMTRELGPVLAGLMVAGRVGAAMAAELGTMRVTDQIDALTTLSTSPMKYLVAPRLLAGTLALPLLVVIADILGVMGGFIVSVLKLGFNENVYLTNTLNFVQSDDVISGLAKAAVFGFIIALMGCYQGYNSRGGAQGVGAATTAAVVSASILILASDYVLTEMFFSRTS